jgi:hypothetical protein
MQSSMAEHSLSYLPHAPSNPTHQQFAPSTPPPPPPGASTPAPALHALKLTGQDTTAARAETLIGAEANTRPPAGRGNGAAIAIGSIALLALGGGGAWFMAKRNASTSPTPESAVAAKPPLAPPASATTTLPAPSADPAKPAESAATVAPTSAIRLDVSSQPVGATLLKNGFQVCDATPCEVLATPNETLEFQATKGTLKGSVKVLAQRDQKVDIKLSAPSAPAPAKHDAQRMCEVEVDGLKILRACK